MRRLGEDYYSVSEFGIINTLVNGCLDMSLESRKLSLDLCQKHVKPPVSHGR